MLAGSDVELVGASPGHLVADRLQDGQEAVEGAGGEPLTGPDQGTAPGDVVVGDAGQVDGDSVAGADRRQRPLVALQRPHPDLGAGR